MERHEAKRITAAIDLQRVVTDRRFDVILAMLARLERALVESGKVPAGTLRQAIDDALGLAVEDGRPLDQGFIDVLHRRFP